MAASLVIFERSGLRKRSRLTEKQIVYALRQGESGIPISDLSRQLSIA